MAGWRPDRYGGLRTLLAGANADAEIREEFEHHIAERVAANVARGMSPAAAREDALRRFGDQERFRSETRAIDERMEREARRMEIVGTLRRELRQAWRGLVRAPEFAVIALITLALGIGASSVVYTLLHRVVLEPLPYPAAERLVRIDHPVPAVSADAFWGLSTASYAQFLQRSRSLDELAVYWPTEANVRAGEAAIMADVVQVSANLFELLGARALRGRLLLPSDDVPDAARVAVLDWGYWQRELGGDATVLGRTLEWNGNPVEVVGIAEPDFRVPEQHADLYVARRISLAGPHVNWHHLSAIGRVAPGATPATVQAELAQLTAGLPEAYPDVYGGGFMKDGGFHVRVQDLRAAIVGDTAQLLWLMLGSVVLVLLIACANVANLFLVRSESRRNERVLRNALGAARSHIFVQAFTEALLLAAAAGVLGLWLAHNGLRLVVALAPTSLPRVSEAGIAWETVAFVGVLVLLSALVFASFPLLRRVDWAALREGGRGATASRRQLAVRTTLVTGQIALAVVLLAAAGLMLRTFDQLRRVDVGVQTENALMLTVHLPSARYSDGWDATTNFWRTLGERVRALPGVQHAGTTSNVPLAGEPGCAVLVNRPAGAEGGGLGCVPNLIVTPGYFEALGIAVRGRTPTWDDVSSGTGAIVISQSLAERIWPGEDAIGRLIRVPNMPPEEGRWYEIVGVADDVRMEGAHEAPTQIVYYPIREIEGAPLWRPQTAQALIVRTSGSDPLQLTGALRQIVREMEPAAAIADVQTMEQVARASLARTSFIMALIGTAGAMALVLSVVGLYGVITYTVGQRRGELGIRMAMGAGSARIGGMVVLDALRLGAIGVILGLVGAALTTGAMRSLLFGVEPTDGLTLVVVAALLLVVAAIASLVPAQRAARTDPVEVLRG